VANKVLVSIPQETVNDETVRILAWKVASGSRVEKEQFICEVETSKAVMEINAPAAGIVEYSCAAGEDVPVGATICAIVPEGAMEELAPTKPMPEALAATAAASPVEDLPPARFTPLALRIAAEHGVDIASFPAGTLVRQTDVLRKAGKLAPPSPVAKKKLVKEAAEEENVPVPGVPVQWVDLPRRKILEGKILGKGQAKSIQSSVTSTCRAAKLRVRVDKLALPAAGLNALVVFEAARLLRKFSVFNALHDRGRIGQYGEVNVGWAVDGGQGLVVPVIPQADQKDVREISTIMQRQLEAYLENKLTPADFAGGTFTISDLSGEGISVFQPLIGQGQSAILGIGSDRDSEGGELFYLTLAFDHQLGEGRKAAQFVRDLCTRLEAHAELEQPAMESGGKMYCALCQRDKNTLQRLKAVLLRSEVPAGFVCSFCVSGW
jgi:pyruvate dehydrogenase E2 component (dihydrolipoamide acetyltransferase)